MRLQFRDPDHATLVGTDKSRQQILKRYFLRLHGVAAGGEFKPRFGERADPPGDIRICLSLMKGAQCLAVYDKRDGDVVGTADTVEMVLDVAEDEADLVEVA